jgi:hypothetical protein
MRVWNGSAWVTAKSARVWNGSAWVNAKSAKVWNGSAWVNFLSSVNIENASETSSGAGFDNAFAEAGYILSSDGTASTFSDSGTFFEFDLAGQWFVGGSISDFSVRATLDSVTGSGAESVTGTFDSWLSLSTTRQWSLITNAVGNDDFQFANLSMTIEIAYTDDTSKIIDSATITLDVSAQVI